MIRGERAQSALTEWMAEPALILGIGYPMRGDDAAGPMVCARLGSPCAVDCGDAPERFLGLAGDSRFTRLLLVDAVDFGGAAGEIAFCLSGDLVERFGTTHDSGLALLARFVEQEYGKPVALLGIQPATVRFGADMTLAVREAVDRVSAWLKTAILEWLPASGGCAPLPAEMEAAWTRS